VKRNFQRYSNEISRENFSRWKNSEKGRYVDVLTIFSHSSDYFCREKIKSKKIKIQV